MNSHTILRTLADPFLQHAIIELPASIQFLLIPSRQLGRPTPHAHPLIRQYAVLLFSSVVISLSFAFRSHPPSLASSADANNALTGQVALALGLYHIGPIIRSGAKLRDIRRRDWSAREVEAAVYVVVHVIVGGGLFRKALSCLG